MNSQCTMIRCSNLVARMNHWMVSSLMIRSRSFVSQPQKIVDPAKDPDNELVYRGPISRMVRNVKFLSLSTTLIGVSVQPFLLTKLMESDTTGSKVLYSAAVGVASCVIISPMLLHFFTKRYVTELYYNSKKGTYTACTMSIFSRKKYMAFHQSDVKVPPALGPFTSFLVNGKPLLVDPFAFRHITIYKRLTGLDKVPVFNLEELEAHEGSQTNQTNK